MYKETYTDKNDVAIIADAINHQTVEAFNLDKAIDSAQQKLLSLQSDEGYWVFELEADCCIPAEYIINEKVRIVISVCSHALSYAAKTTKAVSIVKLLPFRDKKYQLNIISYLNAICK